MTLQTDLCETWSETPKARFSGVAAHMVSLSVLKQDVNFFTDKIFMTVMQNYCNEIHKLTKQIMFTQIKHTFTPFIINFIEFL